MKYLSGEKYSFHDFELDPSARVLSRGGEHIAINAKALEILIELIRKRGEVVTKDQLFDAVWPDQFVEENNLTVQISSLRKILGETKSGKQFISTIPGRGYAFVAPLISNGPETSLFTSLAHSEHDSDELIGRDRELFEIRDLLSSGKARLITLTGTGGSGKTRLAQTIFERYEGECHFVELAEIREPDLLVFAIVEKLEVRQSRGASPIESLNNFLSDRKSLLVLDNFEQILQAANVLKVLLDHSPKLTILVTSRAPLRLTSEREYKVEPLALSHEGNGHESAAIRLFVVRAKAARHTFTLTDANAVDVAAICKKLDGLPLAIELAAARIKVLSPKAILERLQKSLELLTGGGPDLPDRQKTIRNTLEWSYDLLDDGERGLFRGLAVFAGGFTLETAEALFSKYRDLSASVLDLISSLTDSGLVTTKVLPNESVRLGMLEVVREFALDHLAESGDLDMVRQLHAEHFLSLAEEAEPHLTSHDSAEWTETLHDEMDNIRSAILFCLSSNGTAAARIAAAVRYYWLNRSQLIEGCYWLEQALQVSGEASIDVNFKLLAGLASVYRLRGDHQRSQHFYQLALEATTEAGRDDLIALATAGLGTVARLDGQNDIAREYFERALTISRGVADQRGISIALNCLADVLLHEGDRQGARESLTEALGIYEQLGQSEAECNNLNILGRIALENGEVESAYQFYSRALAIARSLDNQINTIDALIGFSAMACRSGNQELSAAFSGAADNLREAIDYKLEPAEEAFQSTYLEETRSKLDERSFIDASNFGRENALTTMLDLTGRDLADLSKPFRVAVNEIVIETRSRSTIIIEEK